MVLYLQTNSLTKLLLNAHQVCPEIMCAKELKTYTYRVFSVWNNPVTPGILIKIWLYAPRQWWTLFHSWRAQNTAACCAWGKGQAAWTKISATAQRRKLRTKTIEMLRHLRIRQLRKKTTEMLHPQANILLCKHNSIYEKMWM